MTGRLAAASQRVGLACLFAFELQPLLACAVRPEASRTPAVIVKPTAETGAELERVIRIAVGDVPVTLADEARVGPVWSKLVAIVSLAMWFAVGAGGRWIGFS